MMNGSLHTAEGKIGLISPKNQSEGQEVFWGRVSSPSCTEQILLHSSPLSSWTLFTSKLLLQALNSGIKFSIPAWGQVRWGLEQPGLEQGVPAHGTGRYLRSLPIQPCLWGFCVENPSCECVHERAGTFPAPCTPSLPTSPFCAPAILSPPPNSPAHSSSHGNAISKTNNNLLCGNLQIKVHFPFKEELSRVCVWAEREFHISAATRMRDVQP